MYHRCSAYNWKFIKWFHLIINSIYSQQDSIHYTIYISFKSFERSKYGHRMNVCFIIGSNRIIIYLQLQLHMILYVVFRWIRWSVSFMLHWSKHLLQIKILNKLNHCKVIKLIIDIKRKYSFRTNVHWKSKFKLTKLFNHILLYKFKSFASALTWYAHKH